MGQVKGVGRLPESLLAKFSGGAGKDNAGATMAAKQAGDPNAGRTLPSPLKGLGRGGQPAKRVEARPQAGGSPSEPPAQCETARPLIDGSRNFSARGNRQAKIYAPEELTREGVNNKWDKQPDTKEAVKRQLNHPKAASKRDLKPQHQKSTVTGVAYGRMEPIDPTRAYGVFATPNNKAPGAEKSNTKAPFGYVVSDVVAGEHRVVADTPGAASRPVIFTNLLTLKHVYRGENVRYARVPGEYRIRINKEGLLVNMRGAPISVQAAKFVVNEYGDWFMAQFYQDGFLHHSSLVQGKPVAMAGHIDVKDGVLQRYDESSGHYQPGPEHVQQFETYLNSKKVQRAAPDKSLPQPKAAPTTGKAVASPMAYGDVPGNPPRDEVTYGNAPTPWTVAKGPGNTYANDPSKRGKLIGSR